MAERYVWKDLPTDRDGIEETLARVEGEIAEISAQLMTEDRGEVWEFQARRARAFRFKVKAKLERRLAAIDRNEEENAVLSTGDRLRLQEIKLEQVRIQAETAEKNRAQKAANVAASQNDATQKLKALIAWIKDDHPDLWPQALVVLNAVQAATDPEA